MSSVTAEGFARPPSLNAPQDWRREAASGTDIRRPTPERRTTLAQACLGAAVVLMHFQQYPLIKPLLLLLTVLVVALLVLSGADRLRTSRLPLSVLLFLGWAVASGTWSADPRSTVLAVISLLAYAVLGLMLGCLLTREQAATAVVAAVKLVIVLTLVALVAAPSWATAPSPADLAPGWRGPFSHKNGLGAFLVVAALTLLTLPARRRYLWLAAAGILVVGAQSSTALAIILIVTAIVMWQRGLGLIFSRSGRRAYTTCAALLAGLSAVAVVMAPQRLAGALGRDLSLTGRTEIWSAVERQIAIRPLQGWGWGGVWRPTSAPTLEMWREARFQAFYAHNGFLDVLLQVGVIGGGLLALVILAATARLVLQLPSPMSAWGLLMLLALGLSALSESGPFVSAPGLFYIFLIAAVALNALPLTLRSR